MSREPALIDIVLLLDTSSDVAALTARLEAMDSALQRARWAVVVARHGESDVPSPPQRHGVTWLPDLHASAGDAQRAGLAASRAPWVGCLDAAMALDAEPLDRLAAALSAPQARSVDAACIADAPAQTSLARLLGRRGRVRAGDVIDLATAGAPPPLARLCVVRRVRLSAFADGALPVDLSGRGQALRAFRALAAAGSSRLLWLLAESRSGRATDGPADPDDPTAPEAPRWSDPASYDHALRAGWLRALELAQARGEPPPAWLQRAALADLRRYFVVDMRPKAPTMGVTGDRSAVFLGLAGRILGHIDRAAIEAMPLGEASEDVRAAFLACRDGSYRSTVAFDAYDAAQGLARLSYYVSADLPAEECAIDGVAVVPVFAKLRSCRFFNRTVLHQRILWLAAARGERLEVRLDGTAAAVAVGVPPERGGLRPLPPPSTEPVALAAARAAFPLGKGGQRPLPSGIAGWKTRLVRFLARLGPVRRRYARAWVFIDREEEADDSAEHLYRWVREHHPQINVWFMLMRESADWPRLEAEGFKLMPPGLGRRLLVLNSEHIVSSHTDYVFGGLDRRLYGDLMQWRYTFLQHGVIKDDLSHWLGPREFDLFVTSSPGEHRSVVGDDTPYPYTDREVRRTGLPRHDRLLRIAAKTPASEVNQLLIMPTWRGNLVDERSTAHTPAERLTAFAASDYATQWRELLRDERLREMAARSGQRIVFMPHPNAVPYLAAFDPPAHVGVATAATSVVQEVFARSAGFVTDYTSVAFTMALLRRQVFYYQFDRERFYGGDHNWRVGYFDYERDGFGPVALDRGTLLAQLSRFFDNGCQAEPAYLARMEEAMPDRDDQACRRVYEAMTGLARPMAAATGALPAQPALEAPRVHAPAHASR